MASKKYSDADLVRLYVVERKTLGEIAEVFGVGRATISMRISFLRKKGVKIPRAMRNDAVVDVAGLNALIAEAKNK